MSSFASDSSELAGADALAESPCSAAASPTPPLRQRNGERRRGRRLRGGGVEERICRHLKMRWHSWYWYSTSEFLNTRALAPAKTVTHGSEPTVTTVTTVTRGSEPTQWIWADLGTTISANLGDLVGERGVCGMGVRLPPPASDGSSGDGSSGRRLLAMIIDVRTLVERKR